jgi:hypothetical protein
MAARRGQGQLGLAGGWGLPGAPATYQHEDELHFDAVQLIQAVWPPHLPWWHTPNGENRGDHVERVDRATGRKYRYSPSGAKLKRMGTRAGVFDLLFVMPNAQVAFIELKLPGEDLSDDQKALRAALQPLGVVVVVCTNLGQVQATLQRWADAFKFRLLGRLT